MAGASRAGPRVVVGVTDSVASRWALAWSLGLARRRRMPLKVVVAYAAQARDGYRRALADGKREIADALVRGLFEEVSDGVPTDVSVEVVVVADSPGRALTKAARAIDLLVIGSGGGLRGRTRSYCARHTRSPLVVVPCPEIGDLLGSPVDLVRRSVHRPSRG